MNFQSFRTVLQFTFALLIVFSSIETKSKEKKEETPAHFFPEYSDTYTKDLFAPVTAPGKTFYVSPNGEEKNKGSYQKPFSSLEAARDAIRELKSKKGLPTGGVEVILLEGTYPIHSSFLLSKEDAATEQSPITYKAIQKGKVILTSGVQLNIKQLKEVTESSRLERLHPSARGKVFSIDLANRNVKDYFPGFGKYGQIAMNGHMLQLAQWPNRGYNHIGKIVDEGPTTRWLKPGEEAMPYSRENPTGGKFQFKESLPTSVQTEFEYSGDIQAQGYFHNDWFFQDEPVGAIENETIQLLHHTRYGIVDHIKSIPRRIRLFNVLSELDEPGEWYFDKKEQRLYIWPIKSFVAGESNLTIVGNTPSETNVTSALITMKDVEYTTFRDLIIENSGELACSIEGGTYNLLAGNTVRNGIGRGVTITGGTYNGITACDFYDLYAAFSISGGNFKTLESCHNFATNNIIRNCRYRGYGVVGLNGVGLYFAHNLLHSMNGAVTYKTVDLLMEYNEYYNIGWEMGDFNVAYCGADWYTMNNVVRYNFVHHLIEPGGHPVAAFRNDDNGAGLKLYGNVFYRPGRGSAQFDGPLNDFQNNITIDSYMVWWTLKKPIDKEGIAKRWKDLEKFGTLLPKGDKGDCIYIMEQKIGKEGWKKGAWHERFPELEKMIDLNPFAQTFGHVDQNYVNKVRTPFHIHGGDGTIEGMESKKVGRYRDLPLEGNFEKPVEINLDAFKDISSLNFSFKENFIPMKGFRPIPFENIGLQKDNFRVNPPNKTEYRSKVYQQFKYDKGGRYVAEKVNSRYPKPPYL